MRKVLLGMVAASFMVGCGLANQETSGAKTVLVGDDGEIFTQTYTVYVPEMRDGFKTEAARALAMTKLLKDTKAANEEVKYWHEYIADLGMVSGRSLTTGQTECRRIMEEEFGEEGMTVYTFNFEVSSPKYMNNDDLNDEGMQGYEMDGLIYRQYAIKVLFDKDPVQKGKVSLEGVKILKVKFIRQASVPC